MLVHEERLKMMCGQMQASLVVAVVVGVGLFSGHWCAIIDLYGHKNCTTNRSKPMCYCGHLNESWSCVKKDTALPKKYNESYWWPWKNAGNLATNGKRLKMYFAWCAALESLLTVLMIVMFVLRLHNAWSPPQSNKTEHAVYRTIQRTKELVFQWRITGGFLLGPFARLVIVWIMIGACETGATQSGLRVLSGVAKTTFMFSAGTYCTYTCLDFVLYNVYL